MPALKNFLRYWLPVCLWMGVIFAGSTDTLSASHTSRFLGPFFRWLLPSASPATVEQLVFLTRKSAHAVEYAVLALLLWRAWRKPELSRGQPFRFRDALAAWGVAAGYAVTDEWHQSFSATRQGSGWDVLLDAAGAAAALAVVWWTMRPGQAAFKPSPPGQAFLPPKDQSLASDRGGASPGPVPNSNPPNLSSAGPIIRR